MHRLTSSNLSASGNNLNFVRLVLATSVIYSHCFFVFSKIDTDNLAWLLGAPISNYAVDGFFSLSGLLVYRSLIRDPRPFRFLRARLTRLLPGLVVMLLLVTGAGAFFTTLPPSDYFTSPTTAKFLIGNATFVFAYFTLPGISCLGEACNINGSLWTLPWEMRCYLILLLLSLVGLTNRTLLIRLVLPATAMFGIIWCIPGIEERVLGVAGNAIYYQLERLDRLWFAFALGIALYEFRARIPLSWLTCAGLLILNIMVQSYVPDAGLHVRQVFMGYLILCAGFLTAERSAFSARWPDYSYGMYIYAYPVMLGVFFLFRPSTPHWLAVLNVVFTLPLAALSWHYVERPALDRLKRREKLSSERARASTITASAS